MLTDFFFLLWSPPTEFLGKDIKTSSNRLTRLYPPPPVVAITHLRAPVTHDLVPGPDGEDDGVGPEEEDEDNDEDVGGGEVRLGDPSLVERREGCCRVGHRNNTGGPEGQIVWWTDSSIDNPRASIKQKTDRDNMKY